MADDPTMTDHPTCATCKFYKADLNECRRYPPTMMWPDPKEHPVTRWPDMFDDDWCGEHHPASQPAKIQPPQVAPSEAVGDVWVVQARSVAWRKDRPLDDLMTDTFVERIVVAVSEASAISSFKSAHSGMFDHSTARRVKRTSHLPVLISAPE